MVFAAGGRLAQMLGRSDMQYYITLVVCACAALSVLVAHYKSLQPYSSCACQGFRWRRTFSDATADEIRCFLKTFAIAFGFRQRYILKFSPTDSLLQIYNARNPLCGVDALEFESLAAALQRQYGFNLRNAWRPKLTLGELFALVRGAP